MPYQDCHLLLWLDRPFAVETKDRSTRSRSGLYSIQAIAIKDHERFIDPLCVIVGYVFLPHSAKLEDITLFGIYSEFSVFGNPILFTYALIRPSRR